MQHIYSCRHCEEQAPQTLIKKAEMPNPGIPKGLASPSAIAYVMTQKFADGLPLYRQEKQLERMGIPLNRQTLSNWMLSSATRWLKPFYSELYRRLREEEVLHAAYESIHNVKLAGCWAHAHRKYDEALKALKGASAGAGRTPIAKKGLDFCNQLFAIERKMKDKTPEERLKLRSNDNQLVLDTFLVCLKEQQEVVAPKTATGTTISYTLKQ